jgi:hypothetical protein
MYFDRLAAFLGKPINFNGIDLYSPTIKEIVEISEIEYRIKLVFASFDKEKMFQDLFKISNKDYEEIEDKDDFDVLTSHPQIVKYVSESISFFAKKEIYFDIRDKSFYFLNNHQKGVYFLNRNNYQKFSEVILNLNGIEKEQKIEFKNDKVKKKYKQMLAYKKQFNKGKDFELKDILSVLCNADGNGINIFNVDSLTMYQVAEHFERLSVKEKHYRILQVWANGLLKEKETLPEWIVKTKL